LPRIRLRRVSLRPGQVDSDPLITDHTDAFGECDAGLVDGEAMPRRAGAEPWIGEGLGAAYWDGLGVGEPGRIDHGADNRVDPFGLK